MKKTALYTKFHQVMDYALPLVVLLIVFRPALPLAAKILLGTMVLLSLLVTITTYRVSIDAQNLYLNNLFVNKTISIPDIMAIQPAPFYYGATSGRVSERGYRIIYKKGTGTKEAIVLVSRKRSVQEIWDALKRKVSKA
jgi:hypothetical protein